MQGQQRLGKKKGSVTREQARLLGDPWRTRCANVSCSFIPRRKRYSGHIPVTIRKWMLQTLLVLADGFVLAGTGHELAT